MVRLGSDEHGTWLGARRGNPVRQPDGRVEAQREDGVWLIADEAWWLPAFWFTEETDLTIDICTPPSLDANTWSFVDLELDVYRRADGTAGIVDEDEFEQLAASGLISPRETRVATEAAQSVLSLVQARAEPLGDAARPWLEALHHTQTG